MISGCCDAEDTALGEDGPSYSDIGICPRCKDNCVFFDEDKVEDIDGTYFLNGKEATEEQKYEIEQRINAIGEEDEKHY